MCARSLFAEVLYIGGEGSGGGDGGGRVGEHVLPMRAYFCLLWSHMNIKPYGNYCEE